MSKKNKKMSKIVTWGMLIVILGSALLTAILAIANYIN